ncbi:hypothetical protein [Paractinoplanes rishiriensis]|nr:hypothetical protein [Actinoplanes rishiriensis]
MKFAYALIVIAAAMLAFVVSRNLDESVTHGHSLTLAVQRPGGAGADSKADIVEAFAQSRHVNIGRLSYDPLNNSIRRIYLAVGDPQAASAQWLATGYPNFSRDTKVQIRPYEDVAESGPDGTYFVYGPKSMTFELSNEFQALGYVVFVEPKFSVLNAIQASGTKALVWCFLVVGLVVAVSVASAVALNAKSYGVQRLHGQPFAAILWRDFRQLGPFFAGAVIATGSITAGSLYLYNGLQQFTTFARIAMSITAVFVLVALLAHLTTLTMVHRSPIVDAVKGEVTATWAIIGSYVLRVWSALLIFSIGTSAIASAMELQRQADTHRFWTAMGEAYYMRISGAVLNPVDGKIAQSRIGHWIREADIRNEISVASRQILPGTTRDALVVNPNYLTMHAVYDADAARVQVNDGKTIRVLLPSRYARESEEITAGVARWVESQDGRELKSDPAAIDVALTLARDSQSQFHYAATTAPHASLIVEEPIVVVVPGASNVITDTEYFTMATNQEVLIENPTQAVKGLVAAGVGHYILGMSPYVEDAAANYRNAKRDLAVQSINVLVGLSVLLATAISVSIVYFRRNSQTIFVKYISGWGFLATHWRLLSIEVILGLALTLWIWQNTAVILRGQGPPGAPPTDLGDLFLDGWQPAVAGGVALLSLLMIVVTLLIANAKFARARMAELS